MGLTHCAQVQWVPWAPELIGLPWINVLCFLVCSEIDRYDNLFEQCCSCIMWGRFWFKIQDVGLQKVIKYLDKFKFMHDALPVLPKMPVHCALSKIAVPEFQRSRNFDKVVEEVG